ncbi:MAG: TRAP transporter substrate-binding protein DctP [Dehalococcoidia bacterium]|nr:TRAP transporter substrate-binding protein DctP [Dehalococcoidia bacterium]
MKSKWLFVFLVLALVLGLNAVMAGCASKPQETLKPQKVLWAETGAPKATSDLIFLDLQSRINKATNGLLSFEVHYQYELYKGPEGIEAVSSGALPFTVSNAYDAYTWDPRWDIYNFPMVFDDFDHMMRFNDSKTMADFQEEMRQKGTMVLFGTLKGSMASMPIYTKFPVKKYTDLAGHNMRVLAGPTYAKMTELLGTKGMTIASSELPVALKTGMFDCMHGGGQRGYVDSLGIADNMKYFLQPDLTTSTYWVFMSTKWYESLPKDIQKTIKDVCAEWQPVGNKTYIDSTVDSKNYLRSRLTEIVMPESEVQWLRNTLKPLYALYAGLHPKAKDILAAVEATRGK